jgi:hypothetical protein
MVLFIFLVVNVRAVDPHWSFQPVARPAPPETAGARFAIRNPIDRFVAARLDAQKLVPSPEADRLTLIRRLYFDLIGLPPTPEEVGAFLGDTRADAYEKLVDRLLASPRFGERWARHWLDVARFAETHGFEMNNPRPSAWRYRDYVIRAFNEDKPYDRFAMEQIAGDLLGEDAATGFLVAGAWDQVKSPDEVLTRNQRADELHDMINTTGTAFLALTLGCARCHDHKFDPIPQNDYYSIKAVLEGVQHGERALRPPDYGERMKRAEALKRDLPGVESRLAGFEPSALPARTLLLDDDTPGGSDIEAPTVTELVPRLRLEPHTPGTERGQAGDPGDARRLPNLGRNYSFWNNVANKDVFSWNPKRSGRWRVWISWGCGWKTHAEDARYILDLDGNPETRDDQTEIARVDQRRFADGSGDMPGESLWSGFRFAGAHELRKESRILLRGGGTDAHVTADLLLLQEEPVDAPAIAATPNLRSPVSRGRNVDRFSPVEARFLRFTITSAGDAEPCIDEMEVFAAEQEAGNPVNVALASRGTKAVASGTYSGSDFHKLEHINDGRYGNERSWISNERGKGWVRLEFPRVQRIDRVTWSRDRSPEPVYSDRVPTGYRIDISTDGEHWRTVASSDDRLARDNRAKVTTIKTIAGLGEREAEEVAALLQKKRKIETELAGLDAMPKVYAGDFKEPEPTRRFNRGDPMQPREVVAPGMLTLIGGQVACPNLATNTPERERRLALARWIASTNNPLTARVVVNRLWVNHFGEGIVSTPSDFGRNGGKPSHPDLLDWLAAELMTPGDGSGEAGSTAVPPWSLKHIHRLIVTSATYRQASAARPECLAVDAGTRLLWRFPPRRMDAEPLRDAILAVAGKLDLRAGGPGWSPFEANENYVRVYRPKREFGPDDFRRMVYATGVRQRPDGVFGAFDCPDGGQIAPKRIRSTTPLQALNLLNSGFISQVAGFFAERLEREAGSDTGARIRRAFALAFNRVPSDDEWKASEELIREQGLKLFCRALFNANEFAYVF